jgi:hypothetical protein
VFTNFEKKNVYLFAKSRSVIGQFPPSFITIFLRTCLCLPNSSQSHSKWSAFCGLFLQRHVGSSKISNLWKYGSSFPCSVTIVHQFVHFRVPYCTENWVISGLAVKVRLCIWVAKVIVIWVTVMLGIRGENGVGRGRIVWRKEGDGLV